MAASEIVSSALEAKNQNKLDQSETAEDLLSFCALSGDQDVTPVAIPAKEASALAVAKMSRC